MKYMKQFALIMAASVAGEWLKKIIGLPVPESIYGLLLLLFLLCTGLLKVEQVKEAGDFLIEVMPLMFIPAAVGLMASREQLKGMLAAICVAVPVSASLVLFVSGKVTDYVIDKTGKGGQDG